MFPCYLPLKAHVGLINRRHHARPPFVSLYSGHMQSRQRSQGGSVQRLRWALAEVIRAVLALYPAVLLAFRQQHAKLSDATRLKTLTTCCSVHYVCATFDR
jgi:DICT domain-containing protein